MAIIVSGKIYVNPGQQERFIERSLSAITVARQTAGCIDFAVSPDPIDKNRVNVFEKWSSREELLAFRGSGPGEDIGSLVEEFHVSEDEVK